MRLVISSSVLGVGSSRRFSAVRWGVAGNMVTAWFVTIPAAGLVGALAMFIFRVIGLT
jgi:PiT family inorganic phosphate transporter